VQAPLEPRHADLRATDELAQLETLDNGKPIGEALAVDIPLCAELFRYYAGWATKIEGAVGTPSFGSFHTYMRREPIGVVGAIIPWNFPLLMCGYKLGPSLAAGCTVVLKPAEQTPLSALRLAGVIREVGFPPGVVNVVTGFGETAGARWRIPASTDHVHRRAHDRPEDRRGFQGNLKRISLELGGKSPSLVFDDADLEAALSGTHGAVFFNQGQCCIAGARVFAHERIKEEFAARLVDRAGDPPRERPRSDTDMGPLVSEEQQQRVTGYISAGADEVRRSPTEATA
jgi:phenylacetaldehyde dehydrogenase